ncbi:MAG: ABC transporter ATP-binding protein [Marinobacter sp.]
MIAKDQKNQTDIKIDIRQVSKVFESRVRTVEAVRDFSFQIASNEFVSLLGPSGCGKSTILNMVAGFLEPTEGEILLDGVPVTRPGKERGVIFQQYAIFPFLTVSKNIEFGLKLAATRTSKQERQRIVTDLIRLMGLGGFEDAFPKELSGGMRQRVAIARAYAVDPEIFLMDEPFGALDAQTRSTMQAQLLEVLLEKRKTVLFITHAVEEAIFLSDRVVVVTSRPARIRDVVTVPFPYPREESLKMEKEFLELREELSQEVMQEYKEQALSAR